MSIEFYVALLVGILCGMVPLFVSVFKNQIIYGLLGFLTCVISGVILGLLLGLPVAALFTWLIIYKAKGPSNQVNQQPINYLTKLEKLGELKEKGILSEEEFNQEKEKILNSSH